MVYLILTSGLTAKADVSNNLYCLIFFSGFVLNYKINLYLPEKNLHVVLQQARGKLPFSHFPF